MTEVDLVVVVVIVVVVIVVIVAAATAAAVVVVVVGVVEKEEELFVGWLVGCLTSQQHASVSQGRICSDNFTCCHTEIEVADPTFYLTHPVTVYWHLATSPKADPITPGAWRGSHPRIYC